MKPFIVREEERQTLEIAAYAKAHPRSPYVGQPGVYSDICRACAKALRELDGDSCHLIQEGK